MIMHKDEKINLIKRINKETGHGLIDCKKALEQSNWNIEKAKEILDNNIIHLAMTLS